jgi:hypothetical protein
MSTEQSKLEKMFPESTRWYVLGLGGLTILTAAYVAAGMYLFDSANEMTLPDTHLPPEVAAFDFLYFFALVGSPIAAQIIIKKAREVRQAELSFKGAQKIVNP